jgi:hypothetical protein
MFIASHVIVLSGFAVKEGIAFSPAAFGSLTDNIWGESAPLFGTALGMSAETNFVLPGPPHRIGVGANANACGQAANKPTSKQRESMFFS